MTIIIITQSVQDLTDSTQQNTLHSMEENTSSFADDTAQLSWLPLNKPLTNATE